MKLRQSVILAVLFFLFIVGNVLASRQIQFEITVRERANDSQYILIAKQPLTVTENVKNTSFITNFTLDLLASYNDSGNFQCDFSLYTVGAHPQTIFKKFESFPGGVYFVDDVRVKNGVIYRVGISPLEVDTVADKSTECNYDFHQNGVWKFDPSAHFDLYFIPHTLADARWNLLRDYLEINYKGFKKRFDPQFPGKVNCFLSPCILNEVTWDTRSGYAIDPARSNCFLLYSHSNNTVEPFAPFLVRIYRFMGYAPPLLAEGLAAYYDFPHYRARKLKRQNELPPLTTILKTIDYYSLLGFHSLSAASSFTKYLIDTYGFTKFQQAYEQSTDLTIAQVLENVYEKPLDSLEAKWHTLLDTLTIYGSTYQYFYERDKYIYHRSGMDEFLQEYKKIMKSRSDSIFVLSEEGWNQYTDGNFDTARTIFETLIAIDSANPVDWMVYGNLLLIDGQYDSARAIYNHMPEVDTTVKTIYGKTGEAYLRAGQIDSAKAYFNKDIAEDPSPLSQASSGIFMGNLSLAEGDTSLARDYYAGAVDDMNKIYQFGKTRSSYLLRLGQANLGLALCDTTSLATAKSFLEQARYFEIYPLRAIFITRILEELGKIADLEGNRDEAISLYRQTMEYPLPNYTKEELQQLIAHPFNGYPIGK